jgi:hypothetical protein
MAAWTLIPSLVSLRNEFNAIAPNRDKGADGSIGDSAHSSTSDHTPDEIGALKDHDADSNNEVHALDIDSSGPWPGTGTQKERFHRIVMRVVAGEKAKWLSANDRCRLKYVIWDDTIYSQGNDFRGEEYTGTSDPHTNHAHFSGRYETACENDTRPWGVEGEDMPIDSTDVNKILDGFEARLRATTGDTGLRDIMRAIPWQYVGGGLKGSPNALDALSDSQEIATAINAQTAAILTAIQASDAIDTAELAGLLIPQLVAGVVAEIPDMDGATPEEVQERVEAGVRAVLGALG